MFDVRFTSYRPPFCVMIWKGFRHCGQRGPPSCVAMTIAHSMHTSCSSEQPLSLQHCVMGVSLQMIQTPSMEPCVIDWSVCWTEGHLNIRRIGLIIGIAQKHWHVCCFAEFNRSYTNTIYETGCATQTQDIPLVVFDYMLYEECQSIVDTIHVILSGTNAIL